MLFGDRYDEAAVARTAKWAIGLLGPEGFRGCEREVLGVYKAPMALFASGHADQAARVLRAIEQQFFLDGDFHADTGVPHPPSGRSYRNAWLAWGSHVLGAYHLSQPAYDRLQAAQHAHHGGSPDNDTAEPARRVYPAGGTAKVANALLAAGRLDAAVRAGRFLQKLFDSQSADATRIFLITDANGNMLDPELLGIQQGVENFVFELRKPHQICWIFGLTLRVYARLYRATGDKSWLTSAEHLHHWITRADPSLYATVTNGKMAWGAAEMASVTGKPEWRQLAQRVGQWMRDQQGEDGVWVRRPQFASSAEQPLAVSLDTSLERMFYLVDIPRALALTQATE
jgi:hypothetical protein